MTWLGLVIAHPWLTFFCFIILCDALSKIGRRKVKVVYKNCDHVEDE